jgi:hypothetical protein
VKYCTNHGSFTSPSARFFAEDEVDSEFAHPLERENRSSRAAARSAFPKSAECDYELTRPESGEIGYDGDGDALAPSAPITAPSTAAARAIFLGTRFVDGQRSAVVRLIMHAVDRRLGFGITAHFDETEAFAAPGIAIFHYLSERHSAELRKHFFQLVATDVVAQISDIQPLTHGPPPE